MAIARLFVREWHERCCLKELMRFDKRQGKHVINLDIYSAANIYFLSVVNTNGLFFDIRLSAKRPTRVMRLNVL